MERFLKRPEEDGPGAEGRRREHQGNEHSTQRPNRVDPRRRAAHVSHLISNLYYAITFGCHCFRHSLLTKFQGALDALYRLVKGGPSGVDARLQRLLPALVRALAAWQQEDAVVEVAMGCIATVTGQAAAGKEAWASDPEQAIAYVASVVDAVRALPGEATVQEQACLAIEGLALLHDEFKAALNAVDGMKEELIAMRADRITNERNKAYPLRAAKALGINID